MLSRKDVIFSEAPLAGQQATCTATPNLPHTRKPHLRALGVAPRSDFHHPSKRPCFDSPFSIPRHKSDTPRRISGACFETDKAAEEDLFSCRAIDSSFLYCTACFRPLYWRTIVLSIRNYGRRTTRHGESEHLQDQGVERSESCFLFLLMLLCYVLTVLSADRKKRLFDRR